LTDYKADGTPTHTAEDGTERKSRYGTGRQPWDGIKELGWAPHFAAGNVLKYLRRTKDREHSIESARWYYARLLELAIHDPWPFWARGNIEIFNERLTDDEKALLRG